MLKITSDFISRVTRQRIEDDRIATYHDYLIQTMVPTDPQDFRANNWDEPNCNSNNETILHQSEHPDKPYLAKACVDPGRSPNYSQ